MMELMISKSKIDKIGNLLKKDLVTEEKELQDLLSWRNSFSGLLDYYFKKLRDGPHADQYLSMAKRLKRIESIRIKLQRYKTMRLSTLQDIAGVRIVLKDKKSLSSVFASIRGAKTKHTLKRVDDYDARPKQDGYRGVHLVYESYDKMIEIQLRTELEHIWATAVEVYGALQLTSFKTGEGDDSWKEFFQYLSSYFAILEENRPLEAHEKLSNQQIKIRLRRVAKKNKVIERLNAASSGIDIIVNKRSRGRSGKYALLELDLLKGVSRIDIFSKKEVPIAIKEYTERELAMTPEDGKNLVFVNIENLESIQKAYPNYFLDTKKLLQILGQLMLE
jgi:putative GTP pyrophosphokinase